MTYPEPQPEQFERMARLESVGRLAGGVAHEFNNLLAVILNYTSFVLEDLGDDAPCREDVVEIRRAAEQARELTHRLLVFSRRERALPELVEVSDALEAVEGLLRSAIGSGVELVTSVAPDVPPVMLGAGQLEEMLVSLAVNARDALPQGGRLAILAESDRGGEVVRLVVEDDGIGMSEDVKARAFEPFFTTRPPGTGGGLGLAMVYGIVTRAGGEATIESRPGAGTRVVIELPASDARPRTAGEPTPVPGSGAGLCVLVVEDEDSVRGMTARTLRDEGYEVIEARDGHDGLLRCRQAGDSLDLLVTDLVMPGFTGAELAGRARQERPGLPVVYVSGYGDAAPEIEPGGDVLAKPFERETLLRAVEGALAGRRAAA